MKKISCSIIIPVYNGEKTLAACLEALSNQSVPKSEYEIIVVDDGSFDSSAAIARAHDVKYLRQANRGPAAARNRGVNSARGDIILFTDCDCIPDFHWIEQMVEPFADRNVAGVKGAYKTFQKGLTPRFAQAEFEHRFTMLKKSQRIDMVDTYAAAFRKAVFVKAGGFDESFPRANNEDTDFSYRLAAAGHKLVFNPSAYVYHHHPDSLKAYLTVKLWRGYWRMVVYARYPGKMVKDSYTPFSIKFQALLAAFVPLFLVLAIFSHAFFYMAFLGTGLILLSAVPFSIVSFKNDKIVGILSPLYSLLRAFAFAAGSIGGCCEVVIKRYKSCQNIFSKKA